MKIFFRIISIRIAWYLAFVAMLVATTFFTGTAMAKDKAGPYPESLKKWVDGGKYVKFEGLDVFVYASGKAPVKVSTSSSMRPARPQ